MGNITKKIRCEVCGILRWENLKECPKCGATKKDRACVSCITRQLAINFIKIRGHIPPEWGNIVRQFTGKNRLIGLLTSPMYAPYITKNMFARSLVPKNKTRCKNCGSWRSEKDRNKAISRGNLDDIENHVPISDGSNGEFTWCDTFGITHRLLKPENTRKSLLKVKTLFSDEEEQVTTREDYEKSIGYIRSEGREDEWICGVIRDTPESEKEKGKITEMVALKTGTPKLILLPNSYIKEEDKGRYGKWIVVYDNLPACWGDSRIRSIIGESLYGARSEWPRRVDSNITLFYKPPKWVTEVWNQTYQKWTVPEWFPKYQSKRFTGWGWWAEATGNPNVNISYQILPPDGEYGKGVFFDKFGYRIAPPKHCYGEDMWQDKYREIPKNLTTIEEIVTWVIGQRRGAWQPMYSKVKVAHKSEWAYAGYHKKLSLYSKQSNDKFFADILEKIAISKVADDEREHQFAVFGEKTLFNKVQYVKPENTFVWKDFQGIKHVLCQGMEPLLTVGMVEDLISRMIKKPESKGKWKKVWPRRMESDFLRYEIAVRNFKLHKDLHRLSKPVCRPALAANPVFVTFDTDGKVFAEDVKLFAKESPYKRIIKPTPLHAPPEVKEKVPETDEDNMFMEGGELDMEVFTVEEDSESELPILDYSAKPDYTKWGNPRDRLPLSTPAIREFERLNGTQYSPKPFNKIIRIRVMIAKDIKDNPGGFIDNWGNLDLNYNRNRIVELAKKNGMHLDMGTLKNYISELKPLNLRDLTPLIPEIPKTEDDIQMVKEPSEVEFTNERNPVMAGTAPISQVGNNWIQSKTVAHGYWSAPWQPKRRWLTSNYLEEEKEVVQFPWRNQ